MPPENQQNEAPLESPAKQKKVSSTIYEVVRFAFFAAIIVLPIRILIAEPYLVRGVSMINTFQPNDYLIVDKLSLKFNSPERGDIVVFKSPVEKEKNLIKRIVGLPGETMSFVNGQTLIKTASGEIIELEEKYKEADSYSSVTDITLKEKEYFVMGDNRPMSFDSRYWGVLPRKNILGKPILRLYHFNEIGVWPGKSDYEK